MDWEKTAEKDSPTFYYTPSGETPRLAEELVQGKKLFGKVNSASTVVTVLAISVIFRTVVLHNEPTSIPRDYEKCRGQYDSYGDNQHLGFGHEADVDELLNEKWFLFIQRAAKGVAKETLFTA